MSNLSAFPYIAERSEGTPGLWNYPLSIISANIAAIDSGLTSSSPSGNTFSFLTNIETSGGAHFQFLSVGSTPPSYVTTAAITVEVNSAYSDYLYFVDSSAQKSSYVIGSRAGNLADGLNIWDASAGTMIASFSKQSVRFYQGVVAPVFDTGGIVFNVRAYGASGNGVTSDRSAILSAINAATVAGGGVILFPIGQYLYDASRLTVASNINLQGSGISSSVIIIPTNGLANNAHIRVASAQNVVIRDLTIRESGVTQRVGLYGLISMSSSTRVEIRDVEINTSSGAGIFGEMFSSNVDISRCYVHNTFADGIHFQRGCNNLRVSNTKVEDTGDDSVAFVSHAFDTYGHVRDFVVSNCLLGSQKTATTGRGVSAIGAVNGIVTGNVVKNTVLSGLLVTHFGDIPSEGTAMAGRITLIGNTITDSGQTTGNGTLRDGISVANARAIKIIGNQIWNATDNGISLTGALVECDILGNSASSISNARGIQVTPAYSVGSFLQLWSDPLLSDGSMPTYVYGHRLRAIGNRIGKTGTDGIYFSGSTQTNILDATIDGNFVEKTNSTNTTVEVFALFASYISNCQMGNNGVGIPWGATTRFSASAVTSSATNDLLGPVRVIQGGASIITGGLTVLAGGIGIGTDPGGGLPLRVGGSTIIRDSTADTYHQITNVSAAGRSYLIAAGGTGSGFPGSLYIWDGSAGVVCYRIDSGSSTIIGNSDPGGSQLLRVGGSMALSGAVAPAAGSALAPGFTSTSELSLGLYRSGASTVALSYGTMDLTASGAMTSIASLKIKSGANNSCGTAVLGSNGSVNVANTYVKTGDLIFLTDQSAGGTLGDLELGGIRNSSGFTILSTSVTDTSTVAWLIIRPG